MKKFIKDTLLFLFPFFVIVLAMLPFYFITLNTGEFDEITKSIEKQRKNHNILIGLGYNEQTSYYKLLNANYYRQKVLALGTSRVMQFKEVFFKESFYNCGGAVNGNYDEYLNFLKNLTYEPEIILLGLDSWVFNDAWNKQCQKYNYFREIQEVNTSTGRLLISIIADWFIGKWKRADLDLYPDNIGFNGRVKDKGFMFDGSHYYGDVYRFPEIQQDYQFADTLQRISNGNSRFEWGEDIDDDTLNQLNELLLYCKEHQINVIGFLPPFAPSIYAKMIDSKNYGYLSKITPACKILFDKYDFEFFDYLNVENLNITDDFFIDGFHGSEVVYGYVLKDMFVKNSSVKNYIDLEQIETLIENKYNGLVFSNPDM